MTKKVIKLNESQLHNLITESVKRILNEDSAFKFREGDKVIVHSKKGDFEGEISDFDYSVTTFEKQYDVETPDGHTTIGVPENAIELIERGTDEAFQKKRDYNKWIASMS